MLGLIDKAILAHLPQHPVAPFDRALFMAFGHIVGRPLGQDRQIGELGQRQVFQILVEIGVGGGGDAECVPPERDLVEIEFENLLLGQRVFDAERQDRLTRLAHIADFVGQQQVLCHLLRDGRRAARRIAADQPLPRRADQAGIIDAAMFEKRLVLGRQERADHQLGIFGIGQFDAPFAGIAAQRRAVTRADIGRQGRFIGAQRIDRGEIAQEQRPQRHHAQSRRQRCPGEQAKPPGPAQLRKAAAAAVVARELQPEIGLIRIVHTRRGLAGYRPLASLLLWLGLCASCWVAAPAR